MAKSVANDNIFINKKKILAMENKGNSHIQHVKIGKDVKEIGAEAFSMCPNLKSIEVDADNERFTSAYGCNALIDKATGILVVGCQSTVIPECVTEIGPFAFCGQTALARIIIPGTVKKIDAYAFDGCSGLEEVVLQEGVESLGEFAFRKCIGFKRVYLPSTLINVNATAFGSRETFANRQSVFLGKFLHKILNKVFEPMKRRKDLSAHFGENTIKETNDIPAIYYPGTRSEYTRLIELSNEMSRYVIHCKDGEIGVYNDFAEYYVEGDGNF